MRQVAEGAILNANYLMSLLRGTYRLPYDTICKHEFVLSGKGMEPVRTLDIAKRLMDYGFHPPTVYFPLTVPEAMMIEPTETESKETLDAFVEALIDLARLAEQDPDSFKRCPTTTPVSRLDEVAAARKPDLASL